MKLKNIFYMAGISVCTALAAGCEEQELPTFDTSTHYVHFEKTWDEVTRFSFRLNPGNDEYLMKIPVTLIGTCLSESAEYAVSIVTQDDPFVANDGTRYATTASDAVYDIVSHSFSPGVYSDYLEIRLKNAPELQEEKCIVLRIGSNGNFIQGPVQYLTSILYVSDIISRPAWWTDNFADLFLGTYSDIKYEHFIIATGLTDIPEDMPVAEISAYVRMFIYYLREKDAANETVYEADGITKVLDTISFKD